MNPNIPFSQTLKKFVCKASPLQSQLDKYLQRSQSYHNKQNNDTLPSLHIRPYSKQTHKSRPSKASGQLSNFNLCDVVAEGKGECLRQTSVTNASKVSQHRKQKGRSRSNMEEQVDKIMNAMIGASPTLVHNSIIKRNISTKKLKNLRVITDIEEVKYKPNRQKGLIKEIIDFMVNNRKSQRKGKKKHEEEEEVEYQDLRHFSPYKLLKKSQEMLELHPLHEFKRQQEQFLNQPLNSQNYIKQLRTSKIFVKDLTLKKY